MYPSLPQGPWLRSGAYLVEKNALSHRVLQPFGTRSQKHNLEARLRLCDDVRVYSPAERPNGLEVRDSLSKEGRLPAVSPLTAGDFCELHEWQSVPGHLRSRECRASSARSWRP